jgi:hypothetical protein
LEQTDEAPWTSIIYLNNVYKESFNSIEKISKRIQGIELVFNGDSSELTKIYRIKK